MGDCKPGAKVLAKRGAHLYAAGRDDPEARREAQAILRAMRFGPDGRWLVAGGALRLDAAGEGGDLRSVEQDEQGAGVLLERRRFLVAQVERLAVPDRDLRREAGEMGGRSLCHAVEALLAAGQGGRVEGAVQRLAQMARAGGKAGLDRQQTKHGMADAIGTGQERPLS